MLEIYASESVPQLRLEELRSLAVRRDVPLRMVDAGCITRVCRTREHQGLAAKMPPFPYVGPAAATGDPPARRGVVLVLDGLQDAYNVGALLRSADIFGVQGVCLAEREQTGVTSMVARASAGAVNSLPICRLSNAAEMLEYLRERDVQIVGASEKGDRHPADISWKRPTTLVMGGESRGIRAALKRYCHHMVRIPQRPGSVPSLNVAAAAAVLLYEAFRARSVFRSG